MKRMILFVAGLFAAILIVELVIPVPEAKATVAVRHVIKKERPVHRLAHPPGPAGTSQPAPVARPPSDRPVEPESKAAPASKMDLRDMAKIALSIFTVGMAGYLLARKGSTSEDRKTGGSLIAVVAGWWFV